MLDKATITKVAADARRSMGVDFVWRQKTAQGGPPFVQQILGALQGGANYARGQAERAIRWAGVTPGAEREVQDSLAALKLRLESAAGNADRGMKNRQFNLSHRLSEAGHNLREREFSFSKKTKGIDTATRVADLLGVHDFTKPIATAAGEKVTKRLFPKKGLGAFMKENPLVAYPLLAGTGLTVGTHLDEMVGGTAGFIKERMTRERDFQSMLDNNPEVNAAFQTKPKIVRQAFESIRRYNPDVSGDPLVTGSLVNNMVIQSGMTSGTPTMDLETANKLIKMRPDAGRPSGLGESFRHGVEKALPGVD